MDTDTARDDLAFMRALVSGPDDGQRTFGVVYFAAGLCYGVQMLLHATQNLGWAPQSGLIALSFGVGPTLVFLGLLVWLLRRAGPQSGGLVSRAVGSIFGAVGLANIVLMVIIGSAAWREQSLNVWLIYAPIVLALQGAAWLAAASLRRKAWFAWVAAGWFATALAMTAAIPDMSWYVGVAGLGFVFFMLVPGAVMMRRPRTA